MNTFFKHEVPHAYSRAQAIADGVLVDVSSIAAAVGFKVPVAITCTAWADCVEWNEEVKARKSLIQDESGRLWDVLWIAFLACRAKGGSSRRIFELYRVPREGRGIHPCRVALAVTIGPGDDLAPVITIMQPTED